MKNKHARRERFLANEEQVEKTLEMLGFLQRQVVHQGASLIALKLAINKVGEVGGLKKVNISKIIDEGFKEEYEKLRNPKVDAGEVEYADNEGGDFERYQGAAEAFQKEIQQNPRTVEEAGRGGGELLDDT